VDSTVEYAPQHGNYPGGVRFGATWGHEWSCQAGGRRPFYLDSGGTSGTPETPSDGRDRGSRPGGLREASRYEGRHCSVGAGGIVAGAIGRGEVRLYQFPSPDKQRPVVVLTKDSAISYLSAVTVAPITSAVRSVPSEVLLTEEDGMKGACAVQSPQPRHGIQGALGAPRGNAQLRASGRDLCGPGLRTRLYVIRRRGCVKRIAPG
jgi:mRNA interferase MazF